MQQQPTIKELVQLAAAGFKTALRIEDDGSVTVLLNDRVYLTGVNLEQLRATIPKRKN